MSNNIFKIDRSAFNVPEAVLDGLSTSSKAAVMRLLEQAPGVTDLSMYPTGRLAAVLVLLYEQSQILRVLLTTRSKNLRSHPGQTALPGGRFEEIDKNLIDTAYREAHEEVGLPQQSEHMHTLCLLPPTVSLHKLIVTPVVALLTDVSLLESLMAEASEVSRIFDHPLEAILDPEIMADEPLVEILSEDWPYQTEYYKTTDNETVLLNGSMYRMHRFRSSASPVKGLTSDILIQVAEIAYARPTSYERFAPSQITTFTEMAEAMKQYEDEEERRIQEAADKADALARERDSKEQIPE